MNFDLSGSACLRACSQCKFREGGFQVWFEGLEFYDSPNKASFQWEHEVRERECVCVCVCVFASILALVIAIPLSLYFSYKCAFETKLQVCL